MADNSTADRRSNIPGAANSQALARGLHILRMLVDEGESMTATEIGRRIGLHQSSASRILATLSEAGYVRKNEAGRFVADYGVLALASATTKLPLMQRPRPALEEFLSEHPTLTVSICMLFRDEMIYLLRAHKDRDPLVYWSGGFPLNISSPGLRLVVDLDDDDAIAILKVSRQRFGWGGRPEVVPATEEGVLAKARSLVDDDVLILSEWFHQGHIGGAIPLDTPEPHPVALAIVDERAEISPEKLTVLLHQARRVVEHSFLNPARDSNL
ncbi:helix-turn-helix domain-containing protein [Microlunatus elymi]|nr:helix-turn-helix domain-containing protein [Microlunatus elymi]